MESKRIWRKLAVTKTEQESVGDRVGYRVHRLRQSQTRLADVADSDEKITESLSGSVDELHKDSHVRIGSEEGNCIY
jgi:hypothetical protein